jgi:hypothetical protein
LLYFGPETYLPLASAAAGLLGLLLTFWRRVVGWGRRAFSWAADLLGGRTPRPSSGPKVTGRTRSSPTKPDE